MNRVFVTLLAVAFSLAGCVNTKENIEAAGFKSAEEAQLFVPDYIFYAQQITPDEWRAFYARFPEYERVRNSVCKAVFRNVIR